MQSVRHPQTTTQSAHCSDSPFVQDTTVPLTTSTVALATNTLPLATSPLFPDTPSVTTGASVSSSPTISERSSAITSRSISTSSLLSEDPYGKKIEDLKELVQRLESELQAERSKKRDTSTLVDCLAKVQAENQKLHQQLAELQAPHQTSQTSQPVTTMNDAQAMDISHAKTQQEMEIQALREENRRLQNLLQGSSSEKDQEINRLNRCNAELTESMAEQTSTLKSRLNETAQMCQQLAGQLELGQSSPIAKQLQQLQVNGQDSAPVELKEENEQLKDQVTTLNTQLQEVIQMNTRWQSYNKQREEYLQTIKQKLKTMEDAASNAKPLQLSEQQQVEIDRIILQYKQKVETAEEEKLKVADENRELRLKLDRMMAEAMEKDAQIRNLQDQLVRKPATGGAGSRQDAERIQMLEHQVQLCTEDFESERHDRERAQTKIEELEQELRIVRRQLDQFQGRQMEEMAERRRQALNYYRDEYSRTHPGYQNMQMVGRGGMIEADCPEGDDDLDEDGEGYDTVDCAGFAAGESAFSRLQQEDTLQCPKCKKEFPISKHEQLLEHTEECI